MRRLRTVFGAGLLLATAGCTVWPPASGGGMAEYRAPITPPEGTTFSLSGRIKDAEVLPETEAALAAARARLACEAGRLDALRRASAETHRLTGRVLVPEDTATQARRELAAGLPADAERTIDRLRAQVSEIAPELPDATGASTECPR